MKYIGYVVVFFALVLFRGFALQQLWGWFITPFGLPYLSVAWALGISQVLSVFIGDFEREPSKSVVDMYAKAFAVPLTALVIGFIIHLFM